MERQAPGDGTGLILLQMGGPGSPDELGQFLRRLFRDQEMIRLPDWMQSLQPLLGSLYGTYRAGKVRPEYEAIGWSQLVPKTRSLATRVEDRLDGRLAGVTTAMRYTQPRARSAVRTMLQADPERLLALTLYPFYSHATTGSSVKDLEKAVQREDFQGPVEVVERWGSNPGFIQLTADWTRQVLAEHDRDELGEVAILLSTHGIPQAYVEQGDPYQGEVKEAAGRLDETLHDVDRVELAFQSDVGPVEWLRPYVPEKIDELADDGIDTLVIVPFGFVSEHIETLYEIDVTYRNHALDAGIQRVLRVPAFDDDPAFAELLTQIVDDHLGGSP